MNEIKTDNSQTISRRKGVVGAGVGLLTLATVAAAGLDRAANSQASPATRVEYEPLAAQAKWNVLAYKENSFASCVILEASKEIPELPRETRGTPYSYLVEGVIDTKGRLKFDISPYYGSPHNKIGFIREIAYSPRSSSVRRELWYLSRNNFQREFESVGYEGFYSAGTALDSDTRATMMGFSTDGKIAVVSTANYQTLFWKVDSPLEGRGIKILTLQPESPFYTGSSLKARTLPTPLPGERYQFYGEVLNPQKIELGWQFSRFIVETDSGKYGVEPLGYRPGIWDYLFLVDGRERYFSIQSVQDLKLKEFEIGSNRIYERSLDPEIYKDKPRDSESYLTGVAETDGMLYLAVTHIRGLNYRYSSDRSLQSKGISTRAIVFSAGGVVGHTLQLIDLKTGYQQKITTNGDFINDGQIVEFHATKSPFHTRPFLATLLHRVNRPPTNSSALVTLDVNNYLRNSGAVWENALLEKYVESIATPTPPSAPTGRPIYSPTPFIDHVSTAIAQMTADAKTAVANQTPTPTTPETATNTPTPENTPTNTTVPPTPTSEFSKTPTKSPTPVKQSEYSPTTEPSRTPSSTPTTVITRRDLLHFPIFLH